MEDTIKNNPTHYYYQKRATTHGIPTIIAGIIVLSFYVLLHEINDIPTIMLNFLSYLCLIVSFFLVLRGFSLIFWGGEWQVKVSPERLYQQTPSKTDKLGSFSGSHIDIKLSEIKWVEYDSGRGEHIDSFHRKQCLVHTQFDDNVLIIHNESGVDLDRLVNALKKNDVTIKII